MSEFDDGQDAGRSKAWFIIAAAVLVLIVTMGVIASIAALNDDARPSAEPTEPPPAQPTDPAESICDLPGHERKGTLNSPPEGVTWTLVGSFAAPESSTAGPGVKTSSGLRYCYAHTPEGALLAAANIYTWGEASKNDRRAVIEHGVAAGPGYDAAMAKADDETSTTSTTLVQIRGFRLLSYSGDTALVDLAFQGGSAGSYAHHEIELVWEKGDWRLPLRPDGSLSDGAALPDLTGYIPWAGA